MLMKDNKKNRATIIVASMKNKGDEYRAKPQNGGAEVADADELYMIADDMMKSIEDRDIRSFKQSLEAFIQCCMDSDSDQEHSSEQSDESEPEMQESEE